MHTAFAVDLRVSIGVGDLDLFSILEMLFPVVHNAEGVKPSLAVMAVDFFFACRGCHALFLVRPESQQRPDPNAVLRPVREMPHFNMLPE